MTPRREALPPCPPCPPWFDALCSVSTRSGVEGRGIHRRHHDRVLSEAVSSPRGPSRMAIRSLLRAPVMSAGAIATLALGVGALTATFALVDAALLREPPFDDARRLAVLKLVRHPVG